MVVQSGYEATVMNWLVKLESFKVVVLLCLVGPGKQKYRLHSSMHRNLRLFRFKDNNYIAQLVFPATSEWIKLELHIEMYGHILAIEIDGPVSIHHSENIFCILYAAVHYLTKNPTCISPHSFYFFVQLSSITGGTLLYVFERGSYVQTVWHWGRFNQYFPTQPYLEEKENTPVSTPQKRELMEPLLQS